MATSVRTRGPVTASAIPDTQTSNAVAPEDTGPSTQVIPQVGSGWCWGSEWGSAWDSPDIEVMVYVAGGGVSDAR